MQKQVRLPGLFQRRPEAGDQMVRQIADEPDRIAQQHGPPARQLPAAGPRVERGEQQVLGENVGAGQRIEQRALAGVGVADQRNGHLRPLCGHLALAAMFDRGVASADR